MSVIRRSRLGLAALAGVVAAGGIASASALAASSAGVTATIPVAPPAVKSVTVSATSETYGCPSGSAGALTFPNATCGTPSFTVSDNGTASETIEVNGANAVPSDNGTPWTLCGANGGTPCTGTSGPGANEFDELPQSSTGYSEHLSTTPAADCAFSETGSGATCGAATAGQSQSESVSMTGPASSADTSSSFKTTVTWTAV